MTDRYKMLWERFRKDMIPPQEALIERARLCSRLWPEDTTRSLWTADLLLEDSFWFKLPWDMEQTAEPVHFPSGIDWGHYPGNDPEFTFQLNRHRYWICLGQSYLTTGEEKYAHCFVRQLLDWIEKEPWQEDKANTTWRTLDAGLRVDYWIRAMVLCAHSPAVTPDVAEQFLKSLEAHGERLWNNPRPGFSMKSNWGVMENTGLYLLGHLLDEPRYLEQARQHLCGALRIQILDDGMQWEGSSMYHNEVLMSLLESLRISEIYRDPLFSGEEKQIIEKMAMATLLLKNPHHCQPMTGDSDDTDVRDLISQAALLLGSGALKFGGYKVLDYESIWLFGTHGVERYECIPPQHVPAGLTMLDSSGQVVLRSGWDETDLWLYFRNGPLGGGHGHADKLHLGLWMEGEEILVDPGRYTYVDCLERFELKSAKSHNVPLINGQEYMSATDSWSYDALPVSLPNRICQKGIFSMIEGAHTGYTGAGITIGRRVVALGKDALVICDNFYGQQPQRVSQRYHFSEGVTLQEEGTHLCGRTEKMCFEMHSFADGHMLSASTGSGIVSRHYNHLSQAPVADITAQRAGVITTILVRCSEKQITVTQVPVKNRASEQFLATEAAEGYIVDTGENRYGIVLLHQDVGNAADLNGLEEVYGLGRTMACDLDSHAQHMTVLQW